MEKELEVKKDLKVLYDLIDKYKIEHDVDLEDAFEDVFDLIDGVLLDLIHNNI